ncbi:MAG: methionine--tRNA ligase [Myxococcales bacterium]|nr:methionine--tRNA ligase [Myxococcales bacterium]
MSKPFYITTPIYYVNDRPHIGHAYCTILADTLARYHRLAGDRTYFLTGTDEHGQKVQQAAQKRGVTPQQHVDELHHSFKSLWPTLDVTNDDFIRTTEPRHTRVVQHFLQKLYDAGEIYPRDYEGWYSTAEERFFTEKELVDGRCPISGQPVERIVERNYFFRMSNYSDRLRHHILDHPSFIRPPHRANEVLGFLDRGLEDLCISRPKSRLAWGIELPFDRDYVTYVWFDALLNYVSAIDVLGDPARFQTWWSVSHHLIGKDILTTHSVYWTTMLMALGLPLPQQIIAHGWWLIDESKMSKTKGNVVNPLSLRDKYGSDVLRYFLMRDMVVGGDANFSEAAVVARNNSDLANDLGNLLSRATKMVASYFEGQVPPRGPSEPIDDELRELFEGLPAVVCGLVDELKVHQLIEEILQAVRRVNKYIGETQPFKVVKRDKARTGEILYSVLEALRFTAVLLGPVIPRGADKLLASIGATAVPTLAELHWGDLSSGAPVKVESGLYPRHEFVVSDAEGAAADAAENAKSGAANTGAAKKGAPATEVAAADLPTIAPFKAMIEYADFQQLDLRVALVTAAERVPKSKNLLKLEIDLGSETRTMVSGIAGRYSPEEMVGRRIVVLANLEPRAIFGITSQGMLLAAGDKTSVTLLSLDGELPPGTSIS